MKAYVRKVLPVLLEGTQLTWGLFDSISSSFPLADLIWVQPRAPFVVYTDNILLILLRFLITLYLIYHHQNVFAIAFFYLSESSGNSVVKISCLGINSKISAWAVRAEGLLACWQSYSPEKEWHASC